MSSDEYSSGSDYEGSSWLSADARPYPAAPQQCAPCSCYRWCISPMFFVVFGIVSINWAPYVLWMPVTHKAASWLCIGVFHVLVALLLGSYVMTVFTDPGTVPAAWHRHVGSEPKLAAAHRLCSRSLLYRPLRSHYCSVTGRVVLNMDHFCPWVVNTVGFYNRKFFILFLLYTLLATSWVLLTSIPFVLHVRRHGTARLEREWGAGRFMLAFMAFLLDSALAAMLSCFGLFHLRMAWLNETTIEGTSPAFDVGGRRNFEQVFGNEPRLWCFPVWGGGPAGDGVHWPSRRVVREPGSPSALGDEASLTHNMSPLRGGRGGSDEDDESMPMV